MFDHTNHGLHLNKKGKNWIVNNLVKEIKDSFLPHRIPLPIVLPWKSVNENIFQPAQPNKGCVNEAPFVIANNNRECQRISRNIDHQKTEVSAEYVYEVPLVTSVECRNLRKTSDCQEHGKSVASVDFLSVTEVGCAGKSSKGNVDSQEVDHVGKAYKNKRQLSGRCINTQIN
jgi:hypothetical protein